MTHIDALPAVLALAALVLLVQWPWQAYCTDLYRQKLFAQRNRLFDLAAAGAIGFDDPTYTATRSHIESMIRFAHAMTWLRMAFLVAAYRARRTAIQDRLASAIHDIQDTTLRAEFEQVYQQCGRLMVEMIVQKSPPLWLASAAMRSLTLWSTGGDGLQQDVLKTTHSLPDLADRWTGLRRPGVA